MKIASLALAALIAVPAAAQPIRETIGNISQADVAAQAAAGAAVEVQPVGPDTPPSPPPVEGEDDGGGGLRPVDYLTLGLAGSAVLLALVLLVRGRHASTEASGIAKVRATARQATRIVVIALLYASTFGSVIYVEHLEQTSRGKGSLWNQGHQALSVLEAFLGPTLIVFLIIDLLLLRFFTSTELATGEPDPGREGISLIKKMSPTVRVAFIQGIFYLWTALILAYAFGQGI